MNFQCKYCGRFSTITPPNFSRGYHFFTTERSEHGKIGLETIAIACPNPDCLKLELRATLLSFSNTWKPQFSNQKFEGRTDIETWSLLPRSRAKPLPGPEEVRRNYAEACLITNDSPKASAAMSRRCLQGIVRDFWDLPSNKRGNLGAELNAVKDRVDPETWEAIQAVREVGDIGAHMEKSVDTIVDVEPHEAELLIELIETLIDDWYVDRHERRQRQERIKATVAEKRARKKLSKETVRQIEDQREEDEG